LLKEHDFSVKVHHSYSIIIYV